MTVETSAGSTLAISASLPATFNATGFDALSFTEIGEVTNITGNIGRSYTKVEHKPLKSRGTVKLKGSYDSGSAQVELAIDRDDAGQLLAQEALNDDDDYAFKLTEQDGTIVYFTGKVMSFPVTPGGVDSVKAGTISVEITDNDGDDFVIKDAA